MRRPAGLLRIVASLRSGLLPAVADRNGRVEQQGDRLGNLENARGSRSPSHAPPPRHDLAQHGVEQRRERSPDPPEPAAERRGIGNLDPAEDPPDAAPLQQHQIIEPAASVEQQDDPRFDQQGGPVVAADARRPVVDPPAKVQRVEQTPHDRQAAAVGQILLAVPHPERGRVALYMGPRSDTMIAHRLGASCARDSLCRKSLQGKAPGGVLHPHISRVIQDPG